MTAPELKHSGKELCVRADPCAARDRRHDHSNCRLKMIQKLKGEFTY